MIGKLFDKALPLSPTHLEITVLGKTGHALMPQKASPHKRSSRSFVALDAFRHTQSAVGGQFSVPMLSKPDVNYAPAHGHSCPPNPYALYTHMGRLHGVAPSRAAGAAEAPAQTKNKDTNVLKELQIMYVDALYSYYQKGKKVMPDEQFDQLKNKLEVEGSCFPKLHRDDIMFVEADAAWARGEPIVSNEEYDRLKQNIKAKGKNSEITELLLFMKEEGRLKPKQFQFLLAQQDLDLKVLYVDALWNYYSPTAPKKIMSDAQFDQLKTELTLQGSSFPNLHRDDIVFVEALVAYARGKPILTDNEYELLKQKEKAKGKNAEITELILFMKGRDSLNTEQFQTLLREMGPTQLETMYIDTLFNYYEEGKETLTDEQFDQLREELDWQGSSITSLHRWELKFVEAALAYARGKPILSDEEYEKVKAEVKTKGKRKEVTNFLLSTKGGEMEGLSSEEYYEFCKEMGQCTLTESQARLQNNVLDTIAMYTALGLVPTTICTGAYLFLSSLLGGPDPSIGIPIDGLASLAVTGQLVRFLGLTSPQVLEGVSPSSGKPLRTFVSDATAKQVLLIDKASKIKVRFNAETLMIDQVAGVKVEVPEVTDNPNVLINNAALAAVRAITGTSDGSDLGAWKPGPKKPAATSKTEVIQAGLKEGIFAWAILVGYALFGETFITRVRAKGIGIHSGAINDFCDKFAIPKGLRQQYIQTAKRTGHDLGFLVNGEKQFGDGLFGKQAMEWWRSTGW
jgi:hypothetical protein